MLPDSLIRNYKCNAFAFITLLANLLVHSIPTQRTLCIDPLFALERIVLVFIRISAG